MFNCSEFLLKLKNYNKHRKNIFQKKTIIIFFIFLVVLITLDTIKDYITAKQYVLREQKHIINEKMFIAYPQLNGLNTVDKQNKLNQIIKDDVFQHCFPTNIDFDGDPTYEVTYNIEWTSPYLLSINYNIYVNTKRAAHPSYARHIQNIDLEKEKLLSLSDMLIVNDSLLDKMKKGQLNISDSTYVRELVSNLSLGYFHPPQDDLMYFSQEGLVFYLPIQGHYIANTLVTYQDIADNMKNRNDKIWQEFLNADLLDQVFALKAGSTYSYLLLALIMSGVMALPREAGRAFLYYTAALQMWIHLFLSINLAKSFFFLIL